MNFKEYIKLAIKTDSRIPFILETHEIQEVTNTLFHSSLGIQTEVGEIFEAVFVKGKDSEIDIINLKEELGDVMWYVALACNDLGFEDFDFKQDYRQMENYENIEDFLYALNDVSIYLLDSFKKSLLYNKPFSISLCTERLEKILHIISNLVRFISGDLEKICSINIEKLQLRYPEKFSTEKAINRNLDAERVILEK